MNEIFLKIAKKYSNIVLLHADFSKQMGVNGLESELRDRVFNFGLGIGNMVSASCGFVARGKMPFLFGVGDVFVGESFSQIAINICEPNLNVKVVVFDVEGMEDLEIMKNLPNMRVFEAKSNEEVVVAICEMAKTYGPCYLSLKGTVL